ncbi:MAG: hypothetical protein MZU84_00340 [Sphingobacterium sp.]|nr:hypothetical protein [Sphingobacterium sp.]
MGPLLAGTAAGNSGTTKWTNPNDAKDINNVWATTPVSSTTASKALVLTNFSFPAIPVNATITGIEVVIDRHYTTSNIHVIDGMIQLSLSGSAIGQNKANATYWPLTNDATSTYGGPSDLWSTSLTPANINTSTFGVRIKAKGDGNGTAMAYVDYATIKVYYTTSYCDDATGKVFSVSGYSNATTYTWAPPPGGSVTSGQGTSSATMDFNGAGQNASYNISVTASNICQTLAPATLSIPISDCPNSTLYIMGNVYWDKNAMTDNRVNGTGVGTANGTQLYATLVTGVSAAQNSVAVAANGTYKIAVPANTAYLVYLGTTNYSSGFTPVVSSLPAGCSNTGERDNDLTNSLTGNDGTVDGKISVAGFNTNNNVNVNFGIKISTPPVAANDVTSTNEDNPVTYNVTANDTDADGTVTVSTVDLDPGTAGIQNSLSNVVWKLERFCTRGCHIYTGHQLFR